MRVDHSSVSAHCGLLRGIAAWVALVVASSCLAGAAEEARPLKGVALIVGQSDYEYLPKLANPENDARQVESLLAALGFETDLATDRTARRLKRDLETFVDDAEGADVALVYYSGHGIEAGGENFLLPVDASTATLDDAGQTLAGLSELLDKLRSRAKIAIVLLDACRTSPFLPGAAVRLRPGDETRPIGASGLAATKSAESAFSVVGDASGPADSLGAVIGFAAAPGQAALDGEAGGNSPYAAALLKHLAAGNLDFGQVMTLVAEEVYLATRGRQQPWTNASLRRLLYFGGRPEEDTGDEALIRGERRRLLLTIAATPDDLRRTVETIAEADDVPLDGLYAMLAALGVEVSDDPDHLDKQLRAGSEKLQGFLKERSTLASTDPEIVRLSGLADRAVAEGALQAAAGFHERAKARVAVLEASVGDAEAEVRARRLEFGEVFARSARTNELAFDYRQAAEDWSKAYGQVARWDDEVAFTYRLAQAGALSSHGDQKGDNDALKQSIDLYQDLLRLVPRETHRDDWAVVKVNLGNALQILGEREGGTERLEEAVASYRAALEERTREQSPLDWATIVHNLGAALATLGERESGTARLEEAVTAYRAALEERTRDKAPLDWAATQTTLGNALWRLGEREAGTRRLEEAVVAYRAALEEWTRERAPLGWAMTQNGLGVALAALGEREAGTERLEEAVVAYRAALEEWTREREPLSWAMALNNLGSALTRLGERDSGTKRLEEAVAVYRQALEERTRGRAPLDWAATQHNLGAALTSLAERESGTERLEEAVSAYRAALEEQTRERMPLGWAGTQNSLGLALWMLGQRAGAMDIVEQAVDAYQAALEEYTRERVPLDWAMTKNNLALALSTLGQREDSRERLEEGVAAYRAALTEITRERAPLRWATISSNLGRALWKLGEREAGTQRLEESVTAYRAALEEQTRERVPYDWALTQTGFASVLKLLGERTKDRSLVQDGRDRVRAARDALEAAGFVDDDYFSKRLAEFDESLVELSAQAPPGK